MDDLETLKKTRCFGCYYYGASGCYYQEIIGGQCIYENREEDEEEEYE